MSKPLDFDAYADDYDVHLAKGLSLTGEDKSYYARGRLIRLAQRLSELGEKPETVMDFGCGTGTGVPFILDLLGAQSVIGIDISARSLEVARREYGSEKVQFMLWGEDRLEGRMDLVFCNGVFHHVPENERESVVGYVSRVLRPGGIFALSENNPWNPGTRYIMRRCPLDKYAVMITPLRLQRLFASQGFEILGTDFLFIFPHALRGLRWIEPLVSRIPIGGQYLVLGRKPIRRIHKS